MDKATKYKEDQMRRVAKRQGLMLVKSRTRDPRAIDYGCYALADMDRRIVHGIGAAERFAASFDEIRDYLNKSVSAAERERRRTEDLLRYQAKLQNLGRRARSR